MIMNKRLLIFIGHLPKLFFPILLLLSLVANYVSVTYIEEMEKQIEERDSIIQKLTFSNELVKEYFDVITDSLDNEKRYVLKEEKRTRIVQKNIIKEVERRIEIESLFKHNGQTITTDELIELINTNDREKNEHLQSISQRYNTLVNDYNMLLHKYNSTCDTLEYQRMTLGLIKKSYDIGYDWSKDGGYLKVHLQSQKADSAFALFPYYKKKLNYNGKKKCWEIR